MANMRTTYSATAQPTANHDQPVHRTAKQAKCSKRNGKQRIHSTRCGSAALLAACSADSMPAHESNQRLTTSSGPVFLTGVGVAVIEQEWRG